MDTIIDPLICCFIIKSVYTTWKTIAYIESTKHSFVAHLTGEILIMENYNPMRIKIIYITHRYMHVTKKYHLILLQYSKKKSINIKYEYAVFGNSSLHKCYLYRLRKNTIYDRINQHLRRFFSRWLRFLSFFLPNYMKLFGILQQKQKKTSKTTFQIKMGMVTTLWI